MTAPSIMTGIRQVFLVDPFTGLPSSDNSSGLAVFTKTFVAVAITAAQDLFEFVPPADKRLILRGAYLNQYTDFGDAQAEILSVTIIRGFTVAGSGGTAAAVAKNLKSGSAASGTLVALNNTVLASGGAPDTPIADAWNVAAGWVYLPPASERPTFAPAERGVIRINAPADSLTVNGTLIFEEIAP